MTKRDVAFYLIFFILALTSCSTDFNISTPYKESVAVYGFLNSNPANDVQYVRVSKVFLGEGNSLIMAQQKDSINYADVLDVKMQRILNGNVVQTISLQRDTTIPKDSGLFYYPYQVLYKFQRSQFPVLSNCVYKIFVHNNNTGLTASAETNVLDSIIPDKPSQSITTFDFSAPYFYTASFFSGTNAYVYNMTIRFHYKEVNQVTLDTTFKHADWNFGDIVTGEPLVKYTNIYRPDFYRIMGSQIVPVDTNLIRRVVDSPAIEFILTSGSEELYIYQQLVQPSYGIVQDRPSYTNIENGIGLFTSRYIKSLFCNLSGSSRLALDTSQYTHYLFFH